MPHRDNLEWLDDWYQSQCNGDWEHRRGIRLQAIDTTGWTLTIDLAGTSAANASPQRLALDTTCGEWIDCTMSGNRFEGSGDTRKVEQIIGVFRQWVDTVS
jgi:hypothetical protein